MPRDSNGNYTLPSGNPVVTGEVISALWANPTMSDLATEITNSLDRQGRGGMLAPFKFSDESEGNPAMTFTNEPTSGIYRAGAGDVRMSIGGQDRMRWTTAGIAVTTDGGTTWLPLTTASGSNFALLNAPNKFIDQNIFSGSIWGGTSYSGLYVGAVDPNAPAIAFISSAAPADSKIWQQYMEPTTGNMIFRLVNDSASASYNWLLVTRSGDTVTNINLGNATQQPNVNVAGRLVVSGDAGFNKGDLVLANTAPGGHTWRIGDGIGVGNGAFSIYDSTAGAVRFAIGTTGEASIANGGFTVMRDGASYDPYGSIAVCRGTASNFAYYGLTRTGSVGWSLGIDTSNDLIFGTGGSGVGGIISNVMMSFNAGGGALLKDPLSGAGRWPVGHKNVPFHTYSSGSAVTYSAMYLGTVVYFNGNGNSFTTAASIYNGDTVTVVNTGSAAMTIYCAGIFRWFTGSTFIDANTRTLAVGGVATLHALSGAGINNWSIWGSGIT